MQANAEKILIKSTKTGYGNTVQGTIPYTQRGYYVGNDQKIVLKVLSNKGRLEAQKNVFCTKGATRYGMKQCNILIKIIMNTSKIFYGKNNKFKRSHCLINKTCHTESEFKKINHL